MPLLMKYFEPLADGGSWKTQHVLQDMVTFMSFNLMEKMAKIGTFDVIFCCRLLPAFDDDTKQQVLAGLASCLVPDGVLVVGADETIESPDLFQLFDGTPGFYTLKK
jgi:chemotaxis protein methyltransferase CheR